MKFDPARGSAPPPPDAQDGPAQHPLFANLETRRKRRESTNMAQAKVHGTTDPQPLQSDASSADLATPLVVQPLRSSAKRKINPSEEENKGSIEAVERSSQDENDFMFNRSRQVMTDSNKIVPHQSTAPKRGDGLPPNHTASRESSTEEATRDRKAKEVDVAEKINNRKALGPSKSKFYT